MAGAGGTLEFAVDAGVAAKKAAPLPTCASADLMGYEVGVFWGGAGGTLSAMNRFPDAEKLSSSRSCRGATGIMFPFFVHHLY